MDGDTETVKITLLLAAAILSGCASNPAVPTVTKVPVPVSCVKEAPEKPVTVSEAEILAMSEYAATLTTWTERLLLKSYAERAEAALEACK